MPTAEKAAEIADQSVQKSIQEVKSTGRSLLYMLRHKKEWKKEAERDQQALQKQQAAGAQDRQIEDPTKEEKFSSGRIVDVDDRDLSDLSFQEQENAQNREDGDRYAKLEQKENAKKREQRENARPQEQQEKPRQIEQKGILKPDEQKQETPKRPASESRVLSPEKTREINEIRENSRKLYSNFEKSANAMKTRFPDIYRNWMHEKPSVFFSRARDSFYKVSDRFTGTGMSEKFLDLMSKASKSLENLQSKEYAGDFEKTRKEYENLKGLKKEYDDYLKKAKEARKTRDTKSIDKVKAAISQDLKGRLTGEVVGKGEPIKVLSVTEKGEIGKTAGKATAKTAAKSVGKAASKSHPIVLAAVKAAEQTAKFVKGRDIDRTRGPKDLGKAL